MNDIPSHSGLFKLHTYDTRERPCSTCCSIAAAQHAGTLVARCQAGLCGISTQPYLLCSTQSLHANDDKLAGRQAKLLILSTNYNYYTKSTTPNPATQRSRVPLLLQHPHTHTVVTCTLVHTTVQKAGHCGPTGINERVVQVQRL